MTDAEAKALVASRLPAFLAYLAKRGYTKPCRNCPGGMPIDREEPATMLREFFEGV